MSHGNALEGWVASMTALCQPDRVHWCDGSEAEYQEIVRTMIHAGTAVPLAPGSRPGQRARAIAPGGRGSRRR